MIRKLNRILAFVLEWLKRLFGKIVGKCPGRVGQVTHPVRYEPLSAPLARIVGVLYCAAVRQRRGGAPGVWVAKADSLEEAYRFMLRLCDPEHIRCIRQAGHVRYKAVLPDGEGSILLSDRVGNRQNTVAVMKFSVGRLTEWKEIRFAPRRKPPGR